MLKTIVASLAAFAVNFAVAAPSFQSVPAGSDEVVSVPGGDNGSVVENKKPDGENVRGCGCKKGKK
jgi:hypothetical protein